MNWMDIPNFDGYQVSDEGQVRTHNKVSFTDKHGARHWKDRLLVPKVCKHGISRADPRVDLWKDGKPHTIKIARLVAFTFLGKDINDSSLTVNHKDGDFQNNNLDNLELISLKDNINHGFDNGLYSKAIAITVKDKITGIKTAYRSMSKASTAVGHHKGYVHELFKRNVCEDERYVYQRV